MEDQVGTPNEKGELILSWDKKASVRDGHGIKHFRLCHEEVQRFAALKKLKK